MSLEPAFRRPILRHPTRYPGPARLALLVAAVALPGTGLSADTLPSNVLWRDVHLYDGGTLGSPRAARLADGSVLVVTTCSLGGPLATRVDPATGTVLSSVCGLDGTRVAATGILPSGDVFALEGESENARLMRYDGATGRPVWSAPTATGVSTALDRLVFLAVTPSGDVVVAGETRDWATTLARFRGVDGAPSWSRTVEERASPKGLLADGAGDVLLIHESTGSSSLVISKREGGTGALLWGPHRLCDAPFSSATMAVGPGNDVTLAVLPDPEPHFLTRLSAQTGDPIARWADVGPGLSALRLGVLQVGADGETTYAAGAEHDVAGSCEVVMRYTSGGALRWRSLWPAPSVGNRWLAAAADGSDDPIVLRSAYPNGPTEIERVDARSGRRSAARTILGVFADGAALAATDRGLVVATSVPEPWPFLVWRRPRAFDRAEGLDERTLEPVFSPFELPFAGGMASPTLHRGTTGDLILAGSERGAITAYALSGALGKRLWGPTRTWPSGTRLDYFPEVSSVLDPAGDVLALSVAYEFAPDSSILSDTVKLGGADGRPVWGPERLWDYRQSGRNALGLLLPVAGDVIALGDALDSTWGQRHPMATRLSGTSGDAVWGPSLVPLIDGFLDHRVVTGAVSGSGQLYLVSRSQTTDVICVSRLDAATGELSWGPLRIGEARYATSAWRARVGPGGDVILAGRRADTSDSDTVVFRVSAAGAVVWGPTVLPGVSVIGLEVLPGGDPLVVHSRFYPKESRTTRLHADDGAVLWTRIGIGAVADPGNEAVGAFAISGDRLLLAGSTLASPPRLLLGRFALATGEPTAPAVAIPERGSPFSLHLAGDDLIVGMYRYPDVGILRLTEGLGIQTDPLDLPLAHAGEPYAFTLTGTGGAAPLRWSLVSGLLPAGLALSTGGQISGTPTSDGPHRFRVRVEDATGLAAEADLEILVRADPAHVEVIAEPIHPCPGAAVTLSVVGAAGTIRWLPGGETTPTVVVRPSAGTTYGAVVTDATGVPRRGWVTVEPSAPAPPVLACPSVASPFASGLVARVAGPGSFLWSLENGDLESGQGTSEVRFRVGASGRARLSVQRVDGGCPSSTAAREVTILGGLSFYTVTPCRLVDTRDEPSMRGGPSLAGLSGRAFAAAGSCGIPPGARALSANVTVTGSTGAGNLRLHAADAPVPATSTLNFTPGATRAAIALVPVSPADELSAFRVWNDSPGTVHVIVDVNGYFE